MFDFTFLTYCWIGVAVITFIFLVTLKVRAPYGRHISEKWGKMIDNHWGWFIMEIPALLIFPVLVIIGPAEKNWFTWLLVSVWLIHYVNRTLVFPFRLRTSGKKMPITILVSAIFFNGMNGFINGYYLGYLNQVDASVSFTDPNILIGLFLFFPGMVINNTADTKLIALRKENMGYQIPRGWLFEYISCPNHFSEIIEWTGFAIVAWNLPALSFAVWTFCNLVPRALNHHQWYHENFNDYPKNRKAVLPFIL